ncbi:MAG: alanine racemase [Candidatus Levybacteria bacterium]|nr:alanine racemase [Candidatus Levybacteria bacterium]
MDMFSLLKRKYKPLNRIEVSSLALHHNYNYLAQSSGLAIAPALKSNAYGHGLGLVAKALDPVGAPFFCVDSIYEGYELLKEKIKTPILIMGYVDPDNLKGKKLPFLYAVSTKEMLEAVYRYQPHAGIHIFVDTGMHREGVPMDALPAIISQIQSMKGVHIEGLMSHFAAADVYGDLTKEQVKNFQIAQVLFHTSGIQPKWIHMANSLGVLHYKKYRGKIGNLARPGIATYGIDPLNKNTVLQPALTFSSTLVQIKDLAKGESSGYDFTFTAKKDMRIGVVAAGYNDGVDRRLSNVGFMKIGETFCKILGRVSMNLTMIDISEIKDSKVGNKVYVYTNVTLAKNSFNASAIMVDTTAYTLLVQLSPLTKRIVV